MFDEIFKDEYLYTYIPDKIHDPWIGTYFEGYVHLHPVHKGKFGELFVTKLLNNYGFNVESRTNPGHDIIVNSVPTEIKFGLATRDKRGKIVQDSFMVNHISKNKKWERLIICGINEREDDMRLFWLSKEDFCDILISNEGVFTYQQGGTALKNDDYMCSNVNELRKLNCVKVIQQW